MTINGVKSIDKSRLLNDGLQSYLNHFPDLLVCGQVMDLNKVLKSIKKTEPRLVLVEENHQGISTIELGKLIFDLHPQLLVALFTFNDSPKIAEKIRLAGFKGYINKLASPASIIKGIRAIISESVDFTYIGEPASQPDNEVSALKNLHFRLIEVILLIKEDLSNEQMAYRLLCEPQTVRAYRHKIYDTLGVDNDSDLIQLAIRAGF